MKVFEEFFDEIKSNKEYFDYNGQYERIGYAIQKIANNTGQQYFPWVTKEDKEWANNISMPSIRELRDPPGPTIKMRLPPWPNQE